MEYGIRIEGHDLLAVRRADPDKGFRFLGSIEEGDCMRRHVLLR
jgi:hypothetical protein